MSTTVDNRVVSMEFDNKHFEQNVKTSMSTLEKLKQSLNLSGASKGLETVGSAASKQRSILDELEVTSTRAGFSMRDVWIKTASIFEYQVAGRIINSAKNMVSALTIDPIKTGLAEYETQLNSVQTILANTESKGSTLKDVNAALDELNAYADKTIYNFTEMTRNIGTFTAAGVDLDTSVSAIKGIANLAAVSGSTSQQASTAMYQLSQALASGTVKLMDWNSVVNAGMGGQVFQDALKETARVHGIAIDDIIKKQGSFRESLSEGWLTSEILTETLAKFTGDLSEEQLKSMGYTEKQIQEIIKLGQSANDAATKVKTFTQLMDTLKEAAQSGWAQTWELIFGDFEEAKAFWTKVSDEIGGIIGKSAENRNKLLTETLSSGWDNFLNQGVMDKGGFLNYIKGSAIDAGVPMDELIEKYGSLDKAIDAGIKDGTITHEMLGIALNDLTAEYGSLSEEQLKNLGFTKEQVEALTKFNEQIQNGDLSIEGFYKKMQRLSGRELLFNIDYKRDENGEFILDEDGNKIIDYTEKTGALVNIYGALVKVVRTLKDAWRDIFPAATSEGLYQLLEKFREFTSHLIITDETADKLKRTFKGLFAVLDIVFTIFKTLASIVGRLFGNVTDLSGGVLSVTASFGDFVVKLRDTIKESGGLAKIADVIVKALQNVITRIKDFAKSIKEGFSTSGIEAFVNFLKSVWNVIKSIFGKIGELIGNTFTGEGDIFASIISLLSGGGIIVLITKLQKALSSIGDTVKDTISGFKDLIKSVFGPLGETLEAFQTNLKAEALKKIGTAIMLIAGALLILSLIEEDKMESALAAMTISLGILIGALALISKIPGGSVKAIGTLISIATSLFVLSLALKIFATMDWPEIGRGLVAMGGALLILVGALTLLTLVSKIGEANSIRQLRSLAVSLVILAGALKIFATMEWDEIGRGLAAMAGVLGVLVTTLTLLSLVNKIGDTKGASKILAMSFSLVILAGALKIFATMEWDEIGRGLAAMAGVLGVLVTTLTLLSLVNKIGGTGGAVIKTLALTASLVVLSLTLKLLGTMEWDEIGRGLAAMAGALGTLVVILTLLSLVSKISGGLTMITSATAILIMSAAIATLVPSLLLLGSMKTETIVKSLLTIAGAFAIFGVAVLLLKSVAPALLAVTASMFLFGAALVLVGAGVALISVGLAALITSITGLIAVIVSGGAAVTNGLLSIVKGIIELIPLILVNVATGIVEFCKVIAEGAPAIGNAIIQVLLAAIKACVTVIPQLADGLFKILLGVLDAAVEYLPQIVTKIVKLLIKTIEAIAQFLPEIITAAVKLFAKFFTGIVDALKDIDSETLLNTILSVGLIAALMAALSAITSLIPGAMLGVLGIGAVIAELALVLAAIGGLSRIPGLNDLIADGGNLLQTIGTAIGQFLGGIIGGIGEGVTSTLPAIGKNISDFMINLQPFLDSCKNIDANLLSTVGILAGALTALTVSSLINGLITFLSGGLNFKILGEQLEALGMAIVRFNNGLGSGIDINKITNAANAAKVLIETVNKIPTSGGFKSWLLGEIDINKFSEGLINLGNGLSGFYLTISSCGLDAGIIKTAAESISILANTSSMLPPTDGVKQWFQGEVDMAKFGEDLKTLGSGLASFQTSVVGVTPEAVSVGARAIVELAKAINEIPHVSLGEKIGNFFKGSSDEEDFAHNLGVLGDGVKSFANNITGITPEEVAAGGNAALALAEAINKLPDDGNVWSMDMEKLKSKFQGLALAILAFVTGMDLVSEAAIANASSKLTQLNRALESFSTSGIDSIINSFRNSKVNIAASIREALEAAVSEVESYGDRLKDAGAKLGEKLVSGLKSKQSNIKKQFIEVVTNACDVIEDKEYYNHFREVGSDLVDGFAAGIDENAFKARAAAVAMAEAALEAAREVLKIESPSKAFKELGSYSGEGFIGGLNSYMSNVYSAGYDMGDTAVGALSNSIAKVAQTIESGIDDQITIRPVLDLSEVSNGVNTMKGMLDTSSSIGVMAKVNSISSNMSKNQNRGNSDVVSAIDNLKDTMQTNGGNTYNINGVTYSDGSEVQNAIETIVRAIIRERRV